MVSVIFLIGVNIGLDVFKELAPNPLMATQPLVLSHFKQEHGEITNTHCH